MPVICLETLINSDIETCFDLSRSIDLHLESTRQTGEMAVAGRTSGLIELGETVTWSARHFYVRQTLTSKITQMHSPDYFVDEMVSGAFKSFSHQHLFSRQYGQTLMTDVFTFQSPLGWLGQLANRLFLTRYLTGLLTIRNQVIKAQAELNQR